MNPGEKASLVALVRAPPLPRQQVLAQLGLAETVEELASLPGIGRYTGAAWLSLYRGKRAVIIDANVARWLSRLTGRAPPADPRHCAWLRDLADELTPRRAFRDYNYAVLDFTMIVCARVPPALYAR